jgi:hypothetical protein
MQTLKSTFISAGYCVTNLAAQAPPSKNPMLHISTVAIATRLLGEISENNNRSIRVLLSLIGLDICCSGLLGLDRLSRGKSLARTLKSSRVDSVERASGTC